MALEVAGSKPVTRPISLFIFFCVYFGGVMFRSLRTLCASASLLLLAYNPSFGADKPAFEAGMYGDTPIAYDASTQRISGYFHRMSADEKSACLIYFQGTLKNGTAHLISFFPESKPLIIEGTATLKNGALQVALQEEHYGCDKVASFSAAKPYSFTKTKAFPNWKTIRIAHKEKSYIYPEANTAGKPVAFVRLGDAVAITGTQDGWVKVEYPHLTKTIAGYMQTSDLMPFELPEAYSSFR